VYRFNVSIHKSGPVFDGRAARAGRDYAEALEEDLADQVVTELHKEFDIHFKHPTGYYKSQVKVRNGSGEKEIHDGGVVYGPWLEGVGSRNFPTTRFRGYASFRRVFQRVDRRAKRYAERLLQARYLRRMN
jgi:glucan biosynthesis protein